MPFGFVDKYKHFATVFKVEAVYISSILKMEVTSSSETLTIYHITSCEFICMKNIELLPSIGPVCKVLEGMSKEEDMALRMKL
jgi:hypothetical protein